MKKFLKIIGIVFLIIVVIGVILIGIFIHSAKKSQASFNEDTLAMVKSDEELIGTRFSIPRDGIEPVSVNLYVPDNADNLPIVFNVHGGAFVAGDADALDTQSDRISKEWDVIVVNINYKLAKDDITIEYGTQEVIDTIQYFKNHAKEYGGSSEKLFVMGYSAGGYHAMAAVLALKKKDVDVAGQILCYPFIREAVQTYNSLTEADKQTLAPALFVLADNDPISDGSKEYQDALSENDVSINVKKYDGSIHGFIEENNPEYEHLNNHASKSDEQEVIAREAESLIGNWINK